MIEPLPDLPAGVDADWVRHVMGFFGWMVPGEVRVLFPLAELDGAKARLAA